MDLFFFTKNKTSNVTKLENTQLNCLDLTVLISGTMKYSINNTSIELYPGDAIVFQPGDFRWRCGGGKCEYYSINVILDKDDELPVFNGPVRGVVSDTVIELLKLIEQAHDSYSLMSSLKSGLLFQTLYYTLYEIFMSERGQDWIVIIKKYIAENLNRKLCIEEIAKQVFLTPNYCNTRFKECTGQTLNLYITEQKMLQAKNLLLSTDFSLIDVAAELGYDYSYFSRQFKKYTGFSPLQFRRKRVYDTTLQ